MQYGASSQDIIDVGSGYNHRTGFFNYLQMVDRDKTVIVERALTRLKELPYPEVKTVYHPKNNALSPQQNNGSGDGQSSVRHVNQRVSSDVNKKCYNKLTAFLFANFSIIAFGCFFWCANMDF